MPKTGSGWYRKDFYPRPPRGGRLIVQVKLQLFMQISIHALREEGDPMEYDNITYSVKFLSTPSARRATSTRVGCVTFWFLFLSTPSARRATC